MSESTFLEKLLDGAEVEWISLRDIWGKLPKSKLGVKRVQE
jgi:hypothetical protein